jgi:hypothetical protein
MNTQGKNMVGPGVLGRFRHSLGGGGWSWDKEQKEVHAKKS